MFKLDLNAKLRSEDLHSPSVYSPRQPVKSSFNSHLNIKVVVDFKGHLNYLSCSNARPDAVD